MITLNSGIENQAYSFEDIENILSRFDFMVGGNWEYDHAYFDHKLEQTDEAYAFIRIPVTTEIGTIGEKNAHVRVGKPFVLVHKYEAGIDHQGDSGNIQATFNQFQAPEDPDAEVDDQYVKQAEEVMLKVERALLQ
ncbi:YugN family protein [Alkalibacillus haloalkaliphilus]|uniref:YugN-like family protein n=1 Tax=Alkalibacillus haloalkaliphilus TaxID=94136 RepID=A0A511WCJ7_9BACI|nr:YugN family protein [Alkalibacillus haloalkaliphilus]GEN46992.1 hypothetical protein AHA02nite_27680 [Alkalibacillus haloalkaliphilus]